MPYKVRKATANWQGGLQSGSGQVEVESGAFNVPYNFANRFGDDTTRTNPEELVGAAHAGCFSMFLSSLLEKNETPAENIRSTSAVRLDFGGEGGPEVTKIELTVTAKVSGISEDKFQELANQAKENCPISKSLSAVSEMILTATLES
jgi:lipoyl-dependent peroxiredoxin